jgi:hypothetical protein
LVMKLMHPSSSSIPHRPQFDRRPPIPVTLPVVVY